MSQWTHVAAVIRFDSLRLAAMGAANPGHIDPLPELAPMPFGSEGPLKCTLWMNPDPGCMAAYVATIWGDLRDYDDVDEIVQYLTGITSKWEHSIRAGVAEIDVEYQPTVHLAYGETGWTRVNGS